MLIDSIVGLISGLNLPTTLSMVTVASCPLTPLPRRMSIERRILSFAVTVKA